jgi:hypothetical protein
MGTQVPIGTGIFSIMHKLDDIGGLVEKKHLIDEVDGKIKTKKKKTSSKRKEQQTLEAAEPARKLLLRRSDGLGFSSEDLFG